MTARSGPQPEVERLRERISSLSASVLRISASLDADTALRAVVESARALTGARYGLIATIDEAGQPRGHVVSGLSPEEAREVAGRPASISGPRSIVRCVEATN